MKNNNYADRLLESTPTSIDEYYKIFEECIEVENETEWLSAFLAFSDLYFWYVAKLRRLEWIYEKIEQSPAWEKFEKFLENLFNDTRQLILTTSVAIHRLVNVEKDTPKNNESFNFLVADIEIIYRQARNAVVREMNRLLDIYSWLFLPK